MLLLFLFLLTPNQAAAGTTNRYQKLNNAVLLSGNILPDIQKAKKNDQDDVLCLALNIYHEIRGGSDRDQWAVAFATYNRTKRPEFNATTVCNVVWKQGQFSWTVWPMRTQLPKERDTWLECQHKAFLILKGVKMNDPTNGATHFYQARLNPGWAHRLQGKIRFGTQMFGRLPGRS